jgi:hypothetical protein
MREQRTHPAEIALYASATADGGCVPLSGKRARKKNREEKQDDPANLAGKRRLRRTIVPVPARAW